MPVAAVETRSFTSFLCLQAPASVFAADRNPLRGPGGASAPLPYRVPRAWRLLETARPPLLKRVGPCSRSPALPTLPPARQRNKKPASLRPQITGKEPVYVCLGQPEPPEPPNCTVKPCCSDRSVVDLPAPFTTESICESAPIQPFTTDEPTSDSDFWLWCPSRDTVTTTARILHSIAVFVKLSLPCHCCVTTACGPLSAGGLFPGAISNTILTLLTRSSNVDGLQ